MTRAAIEPCAKCGGKPKRQTLDMGCHGRLAAHYYCAACTDTSKFIPWHDGVKEAKAAWNAAQRAIKQGAGK